MAVTWTTSKTNRKGEKKMTDEIISLNNNELYEIEGEIYSLEEIVGFIKSCQELSRKTNRQTRFINALKIDNARLTKERNNFIERGFELQEELRSIKSMGMFEFGNKYCNDKSLEEDGKALAKSLLGGA